MFKEYFGFRENPFSENHNINFFYLNNSNKQLYRDLLKDIYDRVNLTLLIADWGVGKTAFLQQLIGIDPFEMMVIYHHEKQEWPSIVDHLCNELALFIESHDNEGKEQLLTDLLAEKHQGGIIPVLIIDNAQELEDQNLAQLLRFAGQQIEGQPLIQVILAAVPAFRTRFDLPALKPYKPLISRQYQLNALTPSEVKDYIHFRLRQVGFTRKDLFSESAVQVIADLSEGIPRLINKLCSSALLLASLDDHQTVDAKIVKRASKYCFLNSDSIENDGIEGTSPINDISDSKTPNLPSTHDYRNDSITARPNLWTSKIFRFGGIVFLALLLAGIMIWLKSNPEQRPNEKIDFDLSATKLNSTDEKSVAKQPSLEINTNKKQAVIVSKGRSEIVTKAIPKVIQSKVEKFTKTETSPVINNEGQVIDSQVRNPKFSKINPQHLSKSDIKDTNVIEEISLQNGLDKSLSREHQSVPKDSSQIEDTAKPEPTNLDGREQQAKNRAVARLELKQSNIDFGIEALMVAAKTADNKILELLLTGGIPVDIQEQTQGTTALALAAGHGHSRIVQLLLSQKASIDLRDFKGRTALMTAAGNGHTETLLVLLDHDAKIDINDPDGWTALMFAVYSKHLETAYILLKRGANKGLKNSVGRTALQIAQNRGYQEMIELFVEGTAVK